MPFGRTSFIRSFRFRVMAGLIVVVVGTMILTTVLVQAILMPRISNDFNTQLYDEADDTTLEVRGLFPHGIPSDLVTNDKFGTFQKILERRAKSRGNLRWFIRVFDNRQNLVFESEPLPTIPPPPVSPTDVKPHEVSGYRWVNVPFASRRPGQPAEYWLQVGRSTQALIEDMNLLNETLFLRAFFVVALAPIGGYFFARQVTGPIANIIATASRLQPQQLSERLPIRGTNDELDRVSLTINVMLDRIADYIERNRAFVANAAHELRSPLAAIRSSAEVALNRSRTPDEYANVLTDMIDEVGQLSAMVNRLLILAESDAGRMVPQPGQAAFLGKVVREAIEMFQPVAESVGVEIRAAEFPVIEVGCEEVNLRHLVRNLIDNAIKFSTPGKTVTVSLRIEGERGIFEVADEGVGISAEDLPRLFERFFRGDRARHRDDARAGSGLGLSICQAIVTAMGGEIRVASKLGRGTTFTVSLPLAGNSARTNSPN